jgi:hypothetical protein
MAELILLFLVFGFWYWVLKLVVSLFTRKKKPANLPKRTSSLPPMSDPYKRRSQLDLSKKRKIKPSYVHYSDNGAGRDGLVYLITDQPRNIAKVGFGSEGRVLQYFQ